MTDTVIGDHLDPPEHGCLAAEAAGNSDRSAGVNSRAGNILRS
jgi:hypothetical protein